MGEYRIQRIENGIRDTVSSLIQNEVLNDPRIHKLISVTMVQVTPDTKYARVSVSGLAESVDLGSAVKALNGAAGIFQSHVAKHLKLRNTPRLEFFADTALQESFRMNKILDELKR